MRHDGNFPSFISTSVTETGWGEGDEWDKAFAYFSSAWQDVVLKRLQYRFEVGPVDWKNPPYWKK